MDSCTTAIPIEGEVPAVQFEPLNLSFLPPPEAARIVQRIDAIAQHTAVRIRLDLKAATFFMHTLSARQMDIASALIDHMLEVMDRCRVTRDKAVFDRYIDRSVADTWKEIERAMWEAEISAAAAVSAVPQALGTLAGPGRQGSRDRLGSWPQPTLSTREPVGHKQRSSTLNPNVPAFNPSMDVNTPRYHPQLGIDIPLQQNAPTYGSYPSLTSPSAHAAFYAPSYAQGGMVTSPTRSESGYTKWGYPVPVASQRDQGGMSSRAGSDKTLYGGEPMVQEEKPGKVYKFKIEGKVLVVESGSNERVLRTVKEFVRENKLASVHGQIWELVNLTILKDEEKSKMVQ
ncbi:hypothetical protein HK101_010098 [Irineochytrium annulatum]|nr:hypothetical protein HK101_010098 [Irineochytrium annulatum]